MIVNKLGSGELDDNSLMFNEIYLFIFLFFIFVF